MQILINIPDEKYDRLLYQDIISLRSYVENGIVLPKGHGRKFEEIVVEYPPAELCTYPEYRDKPYFSIKYEENEEHIIGFGTYKPEVLSEYLREYFIAPTIIEADRGII